MIRDPVTTRNPKGRDANALGSLGQPDFLGSVVSIVSHAPCSCHCLLTLERPNFSNQSKGRGSFSLWQGLQSEEAAELGRKKAKSHQWVAVLQAHSAARQPHGIPVTFPKASLCLN